MDLDFSEEQDMLREMVRGVCDEYSPIDVVREMEDDPAGYPAEFWKQIGELGLLGLLIPESYGGGEQTPLEAVIVYEEFGRALAPSPHFVSAVLSALALVRGGSEAQKTEWLPKIASGEAILTPAWLEPHNGYGPKGVQVRAEASGDGAGPRRGLRRRLPHQRRETPRGFCEQRGPPARPGPQRQRRN